MTTGKVMTKTKFLSATALALGVLAGGSAPLLAAEKTEFKLAWSIYVGWTISALMM